MFGPILSRKNEHQRVSIIIFDIFHFDRNKIILISIYNFCKGIASYEIIWRDDQKCFEGLIPDDQLVAYLSTNNFKDDTDGLNSLWSTIEPIDLVEKAYPELVETFNDSKAKKKPTKKKVDAKSSNRDVELRKGTKRTKKSSNTSLNDMSDLQQALNDLEGDAMDSGKKQVPVKKKRVPKKADSSECIGLQTLDKFFIQKPKLTSAQPRTYESPRIRTCSTPMSLSKFNFDLEESDLDDSMSTSYKENLSQIIKDMVKRVPNVTEFGGKKLRFDEINVSMLDEGNKGRDIINADYDIDVDFQSGVVLDTQDRKQHVHTSISFNVNDDNDFDLDHLDLNDLQGGDKENELISNAKTCKEPAAPAADLSFDEFDLIVMKKATASNALLSQLNRLHLPSQSCPPKSLQEISSKNTLLKSSTPVLIDRFLNKHNLSNTKKSTTADISTVEMCDENEQNEHVSSFFHSIVQTEDDHIDAFEQSIDFKNMDDIPNDDIGSSGESSQETIELLDSDDEEDVGVKPLEPPSLNEKASWDLSFDLGENYIPISNGMKEAKKKATL